MERPIFFRNCGIGILASGLPGEATSGEKRSRRPRSLKGRRPNIILVMTDDQGMGDLVCLGNEILETPNLDALYARSTRFTDFHVSPTCAPTRSAIMSGRHEFRNGVTHTILERERMALSTTTMPELLKRAGYETGIFGKWNSSSSLQLVPWQRRTFGHIIEESRCILYVPRTALH